MTVEIGESYLVSTVVPETTSECSSNITLMAALSPAPLALQCLISLQSQ